MIELKPELREGEAVLGEHGATVYRVRGNVSSRGSNIRLWLTNQRLILKAGFGPQRTLPLYALVNVREEQVMFHTMVRLEFTGGHLEWFTVQNQPEFLAALKAARANAPVIPQGVELAQTNPALVGLFGGGVLLFFVIAVVFVMGALPCFGLLAALFLFAGSG
jgi:hypothetical protein